MTHYTLILCEVYNMDYNNNGVLPSQYCYVVVQSDAIIS